MRGQLLWLWPLLAGNALVARADLVDDIVDAIVNGASCTGCHALLLPLKGLAAIGDSAFSGTIVAVCKALGVVDDDVCNGAVSSQGPILAHGLRSISPFGQTSTKLCEAVFGLCQSPAVNSFTVPVPAPPTNPKQWISKGQQPFQVVHFSDAHIDRSYTPGSEANCTKPICCRNYADQAGKPVSIAAGAIGSRRCDTSTTLAQSMLRATKVTKNSFSIFTGDVIEGVIWDLSQPAVTNDLKQFNQEMQTLLDGPVFPVIGNHEAVPVNSFPRNTTSGPSSQWVFDTQAAGWSKWLDAAATGSVQHMSGSYSVVAPGTNLRVISLNTIYWYKANFWLYDSDTNQPDPNGILAFLVAQLQAAENTGQRAWIIAHMPPSSGDAMYDQSNYFDQIVQRFKNTIAAQFYGHSHVDEFAISYSDYKNRNANTAVSTMYIAPSLTPRDGNPAFKVYDVDPDTYEVMDAKVFRSDLADPSFQSTPQWNQYYSAREVYGPAIGGWPANTPLTPSFWHKVTEAFERDDSVFKKFLEFKKRGFNPDTCEGDCKTNTLCAMRAGRVENGCHKASPGLNFRKRGIVATGNENTLVEHCEGTDLGMIFSQMPRLIHNVDDIEALKEKIKAMVPPEVLTA